MHLSLKPNTPRVHWENSDLNGSETARKWLAEPETAGSTAGSPNAIERLCLVQL